jgi:hypothetical protein
MIHISLNDQSLEHIDIMIVNWEKEDLETVPVFQILSLFSCFTLKLFCTSFIIIKKKEKGIEKL